MTSATILFGHKMDTLASAITIKLINEIVIHSFKIQYAAAAGVPFQHRHQQFSITKPDFATCHISAIAAK
uniref:Uncharacterized protein n=1 Tax=Rosa rugosa TaxID=74645 RepID=J7G0P9_ROSRU|nr:hypothetical protein [Rosa rugosa]